MTDAETGRTREVTACARWQPKITGDLAISWMIARIVVALICIIFEYIRLVSLWLKCLWQRETASAQQPIENGT